MHGSGAKAAPNGRRMIGWTYVARGSALLALPIDAPGESSAEGSCAPSRRDRFITTDRYARERFDGEKRTGRRIDANSAELNLGALTSD